MINTIWLIPDTPHFSIFAASSSESSIFPLIARATTKLPSLILERIRSPSFSLICVSTASLAPSGVFSSATWMISSLQYRLKRLEYSAIASWKNFSLIFPTVISVIFMIPALRIPGSCHTRLPRRGQTRTRPYFYIRISRNSGSGGPCM